MVSVWNLESARGPFTVEKRPLFDEKTLQETFPLKDLQQFSESIVTVLNLRWPDSRESIRRSARIRPNRLRAPNTRPALSGGMDWWRMEWPFSRVRKIFFRGRIFQENP